MALIPVILCGGSGTRLWPLSRTDKPKQFIPLLSDQSPLHHTIQRLNRLQPERVVFIANINHRSIIEQEAKASHFEYSIILEPFPKNTAPAVTLASLLLKEQNPTLFILPADHHIHADDALYQGIESAYTIAQNGSIVCFGIQPTAPETGYGYIHKGDSIGEGGAAVIEFVEKPNQEKAKEYVDSGRYYWNSGMFMVSSNVWLHAMEQYAPDILDVCRCAIESSYTEKNITTLNEAVFSQCSSDSIDYAIMEKASNRAMVPLSVIWNDIGSFNALYTLQQKDENNNVCIGDVVAMDTHNSYIHSTKKLITTLGVDSLFIIETPDALLVANKNRAQDIKMIVDYLKEHAYDAIHKHHLVNRPWGQYETIHFSERFQVKCITVNPGESLSLQLHYHRAEHWVVVQGTGKIYNGEEVIILHEDQSTYIPLATVHRLENPGKIPLQIIEVQTGSYLGEDDIVRLDDKYERE